MNEQMLDIAKIRIDGDTQPRLAIDQGVVAEYADLLESGTDFPPVQVVSDGAVHWLVDGFHRYFAHRKLGRKQIKAEVTTGLQEEAQWLSLSANKAHGLRRTNNDKAKAVIKALKMRPDLSDRAVADHVGVSDRMVAKYRESMETARKARERPQGVTGLEPGAKDSHLTCRVGRDGKTYPAKKKGISPHALTPVRPHSQPVDPKPPPWTAPMVIAELRRRARIDAPATAISFIRPVSLVRACITFFGSLEQAAAAAHVDPAKIGYRRSSGRKRRRYRGGGQADARPR